MSQISYSNGHDASDAAFPSPLRGRWGAPPSYVVERITGLERLEQLRGEWLQLWRRTNASPFQAPGAVLAWARTHAPDRTAAVVVRDHGLLVAVAPVFTWRGTLFLAGTGPADYGDVLIEPERSDVADLLLREMARIAENRDLLRIELQQLRPTSSLLRAGVPDGWRQERFPGDVCPVARVLGRDGLSGVPPRRRRKFEAARRRAERDGPKARFLTANADNLSACGQALFDLHAARWRRRGESGVLCEPLMENFVRQLLSELEVDRALRLHVLQLDGEAAAVLLALHDRSSAHLYLSGFDPALEKWGPGSRLLAHAFQVAADEGLEEMHFLRGREPYKYDWGAVDRPIWSRHLTQVQA